MNWIFLAARLPISTLITIGALGGLVILAWSYSRWRAAVKAALVIALLEGAIRKWVFPGGQELVYFLKDGLLLGAYLRFFFSPDTEVRACRLKAPLGFVMILAVMLTLWALNPNIGHPILAVVGLKIYLYYLPLVFMMPYLFRTHEEMTRQLTWYAWLGIPICLLGLAQYAAGAHSILNVYAQSEAREGVGAVTFGLDTEVVRVRITGTFSYITGHTVFICFFSAINLVLLSIEQTKHKWVLVSLALPLLAVNAMMSGSRAAVLIIVLLIGGFSLASITGRLATSRNFRLMLFCGMIVCVAVGVYAFRDAWVNWFSRYQGAGDSVYSRVILHPFAAVEKAVEESPAFGVGIGVTQLVTAAFRRVLNVPGPEMRGIFFDNEMGMVMNELGVLGFGVWYGLRIALMVAIWSAYWRAPPGLLRSICLAGFLLSGPFLLMSLVSNHTANILLHAVVGIGMLPYLHPTVQRRFPSGGRVTVQSRSPQRRSRV